MENQLNTERSESCFNYETEEATGFCADLLDKQDYLDYIDADMEAFYSTKTDAIAPEI